MGIEIEFDSKGMRWLFNSVMFTVAVALYFYDSYLASALCIAVLAFSKQSVIEKS